MEIDYKQTIERIIDRYEGGYGWDRGDSGGPTKFGITCWDLAEHRHQKMTSMSAWAHLVAAMTLAEADDIYQTKYARQCDFNGLNAGCDAVVLDFGINSGSSRAIKFSQQIVGVAADGMLGPQTEKAINDMSAGRFINALCDARLNFLRRLGIWGTFGRGWSARVKDLRSYSLNLAAQAAKVQAHGLMGEAPKKMTYEEKAKRLHRAFGKAYGKEELEELKAQHAEQ